MRKSFVLRTFAVVCLLSPVALATSACHHRDHRGPAERAGAKVDRAADKTGDVIEDAGHKTGHAVERTGEKINHSLPGD